MVLDIQYLPRLFLWVQGAAAKILFHAGSRWDAWSGNGWICQMKEGNVGKARRESREWDVKINGVR